MLMAAHTEREIKALNLIKNFLFSCHMQFLEPFCQSGVAHANPHFVEDSDYVDRHTRGHEEDPHQVRQATRSL